MWLKDCEKSCTHPLVFHSKKRLHSSENRSLLSHKSQGLEIWDLGRQLEVCWRVRWQTCIWTHPKLMVVCQHPLVSQNTLTTNLIFLSISKFPLLINKYINNIRLEAHSHYCVIECHCFYNSLCLNLRVIFGDKEVIELQHVESRVHIFLLMLHICIASLVLASWTLSLFTSRAEVYSMHKIGTNQWTSDISDELDVKLWINDSSSVRSPLSPRVCNFMVLEINPV